jgi:hypothetical protein
VARPLADIQERLRELAGEFGELHAALAELLQDLPAPPEEASGEDLEENPDLPSATRWTVECILSDHVRPTITNLLLAAGATRAEAAAATPALPRLPGSEERTH